MTADPRMIEMMSYYRDAELHGATLLLRLIKLMDDADSQVKLSLHLAEETQHAYSRLIAWTLIGLVWIRRGRLARAVLPLERAMEACRRKHLTVWLPIPLSLLGLAFVRMGHIVEGLRLLEEGVALSRELGIRAYLAAWLVNLAEGLFASGHVSRARETATARTRVPVVWL